MDVTTRRTHLRRGSVWRRRSDGKLVEVVWHRDGYRNALTGEQTRPAMVQLRKLGATNNKSTHWVRMENLERLYEPSQPDAAMGAWVYCDQHVRPHSTGWCGVGTDKKIPMSATNIEEAYAEARANGWRIFD